jgi:peptide/nickel transport system permease protein
MSHIRCWIPEFLWAALKLRGDPKSLSHHRLSKVKTLKSLIFLSLSRFKTVAFSNKLSSFGTLTALGFLILALAYYVTNGAIAPYNPNRIFFDVNAPLSWAHLFGTDASGRDIFSRVLAALPVDLSISLLVVFFSVVIGIIIGMTAGYIGGFIDEVLMRFSDLFLAFPAIVMALAIAATLPRSLFDVAISLTFVWWPTYARLVRGGVLAIKSEDYMAVSKTLNSSFFYVMRKGILPNILPAVLVYASLDIGTALISVSSLGFLNVGIPANTPELGAMVASIMTVVYSYPLEALIPSAIVLLIVLSFSLFGDGIREAMDVKVRPHMVLKDRFLGGGLSKRKEQEKPKEEEPLSVPSA